MTAGRTDSRGAHGTESISIAKKGPSHVDCKAYLLARWLTGSIGGARVLFIIRALSRLRRRRIKKQKSPRRVPVQVRLQEAESSERKSHREGLEQPEERLERKGRITHECPSTGRTTCTARAGAGQGGAGLHHKRKDSPGGLREGGRVCMRAARAAHRTATRSGSRVWSGQNRGVPLQVQGEECGGRIARVGARAAACMSGVGGAGERKN
ncbi:hypothetical protein B0H13DRAFT_2578354 [Mycena leptocephala]|nr:hypothetical protein B0H13DRAFT_2578354 [Mycena leptocephala]